MIQFPYEHRSKQTASLVCHVHSTLGLFPTHVFLTILINKPWVSKCKTTPANNAIECFSYYHVHFLYPFCRSVMKKTNEIHLFHVSNLVKLWVGNGGPVPLLALLSLSNVPRRSPGTGTVEGLNLLLTPLAQSSSTGPSRK